MRVKLQLVMCNDQGDEETVTDVITLNKNHQRIEHLGLTLAEAKQLLSTGVCVAAEQICAAAHICSIATQTPLPP